MTLYELRPGKVTYPTSTARYMLAIDIDVPVRGPNYKFFNCRLLDDELNHITSFILGQGEINQEWNDKIKGEADDLLSAKAFLLWG
jgi:hypothetical protein